MEGMKGAKGITTNEDAPEWITQEPEQEGRLDAFARNLGETTDEVRQLAYALQNVGDRVMGATQTEADPQAPEPVPNGALESLHRAHQDLIAWIEEVRRQVNRLSDL